jgi:hypothetical protein
MYKLIILLIFITTSYSEDLIHFKSFNSYDEAIKYINKDKQTIKQTEKKVTYKKPIKRYQTKPKRKIGNIQTVCKTPRLYVREYYSADTNLYTLEDGSQIRYKYSPTDKDKVFFIVLKDFPKTQIKDLILADKKRIVIKTKSTNKKHHLKLTNLDGAKRLELGIVKNRKYPMFIVLESNEGSNINKCDLMLMKKGTSVLSRYKSSLVKTNNYDIVYKIYFGK